MADFPIEDGGRYENEGKVNTGTTGTVVTASATANTKGAWAQLVASTGFDAVEIIITIVSFSAVQNMTMDIGIGAAGAEVVVIPDITLLFLNTARISPPKMRLPFNVPAGSRVSARVQSSVASATTTITSQILALGLMMASPLQRNTNYGSNAATSRGTSVDPGGTANTKGAWVQLIASTTNPIRSLSVFAGRTTTAALALARHSVDIGVGAAGAEVVVIADLTFSGISVNNIAAPYVYELLPIGIPAGTRLVARDQSNNITVGDREIDISVIGHD